jgi:hypothetical protein
MKKTNMAVPAKKYSKKLFVAVGGVIIILTVFFIVKGNLGSKTKTSLQADLNSKTISVSQGGGISITKSDITETAKFYPYKVGNTNMELLAVKATDGTIRTAFNTCQVCYNSGKGYYIQEGDELVCQNCGNRFKIDQVEKQKNGCNPVPILDENKTDNGTSITISPSFIEQNKDLFINWKK